MEIQILRLIILVKYFESIISTRKTLFSHEKKHENPMGQETHPIQSHGIFEEKTCPMGWDNPIPSGALVWGRSDLDTSNDHALRTITNNIFSVILHIEQAAHLPNVYSKQE
ncbi:unnamed protein product [Rotaria socialis]|uniref:Uncharacterized protein n=1 Tax=Rotaria socialis TaxID=392032 RepID=A0A821HA63_9BILA|nr:unnamed protein product [Rotaria socialis]CAF4680460.1 unnamed protein product [Rotaria socialis]